MKKLCFIFNRSYGVDKMQFNKETTKEIINCFVEIYGENYRIDISNKINNCLILLCGYKDTNK